MVNIALPERQRVKAMGAFLELATYSYLHLPDFILADKDIRARMNRLQKSLCVYHLISKANLEYCEAEVFEEDAKLQMILFGVSTGDWRKTIGSSTEWSLLFTDADLTEQGTVLFDVCFSPKKHDELICAIEKRLDGNAATPSKKTLSDAYAILTGEKTEGEDGEFIFNLPQTEARLVLALNGALMTPGIKLDSENFNAVFSNPTLDKVEPAE